jgi:ribosomal protein L1
MAEKKTVVKATKTKVTKFAAEKVEIVSDQIDLVVEESITEQATEVKTAKAGKKSAKSIKEKEAVIAKAERKEAESDEPAAPKPKVKVKTKLERSSKAYKKVAGLVEKEKIYSLPEAINLATKTSVTKFDSSVEIHINLNVDPKHADQNIRDTLVLPSGTGKKIRVAVLASEDLHAAAKKAGADVVGAEDFLQQLDKGVIDFDILISTPAMMPKLGRYARVLGPKGLMPNPKSGTVTLDVAKAVVESKGGKVEYRVDSAGIVHLAAGKVSFGVEKLEQNIRAVFASIKASKPSSVKSGYVKNIHLSTTMGPSIKVATSEI